MKRTHGVYILVAAAVLAAVGTGCKGDPGDPGETTVVNLDGFAPGITCGKCHNADQDTVYYVAGRAHQWEQSKHAKGGDIERNGAGCAGCHTTEGFVQRMKGQTVTDQFQPSPPGCFACHSPHTNGDFRRRKEDPVTLKQYIQGAADVTVDYGVGNLCLQCHQPRSMSPVMDANAAGDSIVITTTRWYMHYGIQGLILGGGGGFRFTDFTYTGNSTHTDHAIIKQQGCPTCHMAEMAYGAPGNVGGAGTGKGGGHTMNIRYTWDGVEGSVLTGCKTSGCHGTITTVDYNGVQTRTLAYLDTLQTLLIAKGYLEGNPSSSSYLQAKLTGGKLVIKPAVKAGALYNYFIIEHDMSNGVHNTKLTTELLQSSIAELRKP